MHLVSLGCAGYVPLHGRRFYRQIGQGCEARKRLEQLRKDPVWVAEHPVGSEYRSRLKRRYNELVKVFTVQAGPAAETPIGEALVIQAASLSLRLEQVQASIVKGRKVRVDDVVRLSSEIRRVLHALQGKPVRNATKTPSLQPSALDAYLAEEPAP